MELELEQLRLENSKLKDAIRFVIANLDCHDPETNHPSVSICQKCYKTWMNDGPTPVCQTCLETVCKYCSDLAECSDCELEHCGECIKEHEGCPDCQ